MASAHDVAALVLKLSGPMTAMKLQKLVYYSQAWSLVWDERPLFEERIEAWSNGPVCPDLYEVHRGMFTVSDWRQGDPAALDADGEETVKQVVASYAKLSSQKLSDLTHREDPWKEARMGLPPTLRMNTEITHASMAEYYEGLSGLDEATAL